MSELKERILQSGLTVAEVARRAGCPKNHLYLILHGVRNPRIPLAKSIERATGGLITWQELVDREAHTASISLPKAV